MSTGSSINTPRRNPRLVYDENGREIPPPAMSEAARHMAVRTAILLARPA
ncbi:hypothetical protein [Methylobacterium nodulans]|nr:hypothetical protein [Methylobacterium nodulans]